MIEYLNVSYTDGGINVMLSIDVNDGKICYNLADLFTRIINDTNANEDIVIKKIKENFRIYD